MIAEKLRDEIVESQKARNDLIKWKLVLVAAVGAASLGSGGIQKSAILLALIPFVCLYVDAVCFHNDLRIMAIARFLRDRSDVIPEDVVAYEAYCTENRPNFTLEAFALEGATTALSVLVTAIGVTARFGVIDYRPWFPDTPQGVWTSLAVIGGLGMVLGWFSYRLYDHKMDTLDGKKGWWLARAWNRLRRRG